jgi:hypothetical protein
VRADDDGVIVLTAVVSLLEREMPVGERPDLAAQVRQSGANADAGLGVDLGDITHYADD